MTVTPPIARPLRVGRKAAAGATSRELFAPSGELVRERPVQGFLFDIEGALVLADRLARPYEALPGATEVLEALNARGLPFVLMTDATTWTPEELAGRLRALGLAVEDRQVLTPASVAAEQLAKKAGTRALVLGLESVSRPLVEAGVEVVRPGDPLEGDVQAVFVGWHPDCDMRDIEAAAAAVWAGAKLYAASDAPFLVTREGRRVGYPRAIVAAIRSATGAPATLLGKPSPAAFAAAARLLDTAADQIAVVGDEAAVDVAMAKHAGAMSIAVCTDAVDRDDWASVPPALVPDMLLDRVGELEDMLDRLCAG
jgi:HAD superfamily hydrolase (TIGR01450 family)